MYDLLILYIKNEIEYSKILESGPAPTTHHMISTV